MNHVSSMALTTGRMILLVHHQMYRPRDLRFKDTNLTAMNLRVSSLFFSSNHLIRKIQIMSWHIALNIYSVCGCYWDVVTNKKLTV
jgi:hypothetical protein